MDNHQGGTGTMPDPGADPSASAPPPSAYGPTFGPRQGPRRRRGGWIVAGVIVLVLAAVAAVQIIAGLAFDDASSRAAAASSQVSSADETARTAAGQGGESIAAAAAIQQSATPALAGAGESAALTAAAAELAAAVEAADAQLAASAPGSDEAKPIWPWDLIAGVSRLDASAASLSASATQLADAAAAVDAATAALNDAALALYATVPDAASALESDNVSARAETVLDLRDAAAAVAAAQGIGSADASAFSRYAAAAAALTASAEDELAEKAGPLYDTRLAIEEYARSISGGVVLDFDWSPTVNGLGGYAGMAGTATWTTARGGFSTITLSDSVAWNWPSDDAMALVTHEVGHSITSKCSDMFDSSDPAANEQWATAWAISMGFTTPGNGTQAYGYPPQELIDVAATCR